MFFIQNLRLFSLQFGKGRRRKIARKSCQKRRVSMLFVERPCLFHDMFVNGTLAKQLRNQEKAFDFSIVLVPAFFHYNVVGDLRKLLGHQDKISFLFPCFSWKKRIFFPP